MPDTLWEAIRTAKRQSPCPNHAVVVLPDHLHTLWTLPEGERRAVKARFTRLLVKRRIALKARNALCHSEAHDLGKVFAQVGELGPAVQLCGNRCTSGCLHGVLTEAFLGSVGQENAGHHVTLPDMKHTPSRSARTIEIRTRSRAQEPGCHRRSLAK